MHLHLPQSTDRQTTTLARRTLENVLIFTATYNEAENITALVNECLTEIPTADMLVVDDHSPDGTGQILDDLAERYNGRLTVVHRPRKLGLGTAHKLALKYARRHNYAALVTMDADFSHKPSYLPRLIRGLEANDFVIGSRYAEGGHCDYGFTRTLISKSANFFAKLLLGLRLHETTTSYRAFSRRLLQSLPVDAIRSEGYSFFFESLFFIAQSTQRLAEVPIHFEDRRAGTSKISKREICRAAVNLGRIFSRRLLGKTTFHAPEFPEESCDVCYSPYHSEVYAATAKDHSSEQYNCTSAQHASHGRIVQCLGCGLVFTSPRLKDDQIAKLYTDVVDTTYVANIPARIKTFSFNLARIKSMLPKRGRLLDVGSYYGVFLNVAKGEGFDVTGIEPSQSAGSYAIDTYHVPVHIGVLETAPLDKTPYDIVTSWDVLEHFTSPMKEMRLINDRLRLHGTFAFSTLNISNWYPKLLGERWPWLMDMHLYYFSDSIIEDMLQRTGFKLILRDTYCHIITVDYFLLKLDSLGVPLTRPLRRFVALTPLRDVKLPFSFGDIRLYVAEKIASATASVPAAPPVPSTRHSWAKSGDVTSSVLSNELMS